MFAQRRGLPISRGEIHEGLEPELQARGLNLQQMRNFLAEKGINAIGWRAGYEKLRTANQPLILHFQPDHYVLLVKTFRQAVLILDPARGRRLIPKAEFMELWSGVYLDLSN